MIRVSLYLKWLANLGELHSYGQNEAPVWTMTDMDKAWFMYAN